MIIAQSSLNLSSEHMASSTHTVKEELRFWVDPPPPPPAQQDRITISGQQPVVVIGTYGEDEISIDPRYLLLIRLLEALTGKQIKIADMSGIGRPPEAVENFASISNPNQPEQPEQPAQEGWGMTYARNETRTEHEQISVKASGTVTTADGRSFEISLNIKMSRDFVSQENLSIREGDAKRIDPLVINLDGGPVSLSNVRFSFDLNADGKKEAMPFANQGNGLLALDSNNDGKILDGRELFGPTTGDAFAELARYDEDSNGWIDEKDSVFNKLSIWTKEADGTDRFRNLSETHIGALALSRIQTDYSFKTSSNDLLGVMRQTGLYLRENGTTGSLQQIDLAV